MPPRIPYTFGQYLPSNVYTIKYIGFFNVAVLTMFHNSDKHSIFKESVLILLTVYNLKTHPFVSTAKNSPKRQAQNFDAYGVKIASPRQSAD